MSASVKAITFIFGLLWHLNRAHHCALTKETNENGFYSRRIDIFAYRLATSPTTTKGAQKAGCAQWG